ncbi:unnamed protein product [Sphagnum balticum]
MQSRRLGVQQLVCVAAPLALLLLLLVAGTQVVVVEGAGVNKEVWGSMSSKLSGIIIPGFVSSQLRAWAILDCPYTPLDFRPLDPVWLDTKKVLSATNCWLKCLLLDPFTQADHPECKSRADTGLSAITELDPGYITGAVSSVWRQWVNWLVEFGIEPDAIVAVPYDWRLSGSLLEERDLYFHKLKLTFETARKLRGGPSLVYAHSMGNNVFRYFLEWLKLEIAPKQYMGWLDDHVHAYYAVGAPLLGAAESVKALMIGVTFGLPIPEGTARLLCNSFSSSLWMLPFSKHCHVNDRMCCKRQCADGKVGPHFFCDKNEAEGNSSSWPVDIAKVEFPASPGSCPAVAMVTYPDVSPEPDSAVVERSYSAHQISDGTFLKDLMDVDVHSASSFHHLIKYYLEDPILNPLTPWTRPPIQNVYCVYGLDLKTEIGYHFAPSGKPYPDNWVISDIFFENEGGTLQSRSGVRVSGTSSPASGDISVPYNSLSYCKTWLGPQVNITRTPQTAHEVCDIQQELNVLHDFDTDIIPNMTREGGAKYITYYEDGVSLPGKRTAVWELDKVDHRNIVRSPVLLRELWLETIHSLHPDAKRHFVSKEHREPMRDEDCYWDYGRARCSHPDHCEYRYAFGDVHLGQSCRLKFSSDKDHILNYL